MRTHLKDVIRRDLLRKTTVFLCKGVICGFISYQAIKQMNPQKIIVLCFNFNFLRIDSWSCLSFFDFFELVGDILSVFNEYLKCAGDEIPKLRMVHIALDILQHLQIRLVLIILQSRQDFVIGNWILR